MCLPRPGNALHTRCQRKHASHQTRVAHYCTLGSMGLSFDLSSGSSPVSSSSVPFGSSLGSSSGLPTRSVCVSSWPVESVCLSSSVGVSSAPSSVSASHRSCLFCAPLRWKIGPGDGSRLCSRPSVPGPQRGFAAPPCRRDYMPGGTAQAPFHAGSSRTCRQECQLPSGGAWPVCLVYGYRQCWFLGSHLGPGAPFKSFFFFRRGGAGGAGGNSAHSQ